ncbi:DNA-directed RNA polymerase subunit beta' [Candidatus Peribacteria bacterium RIFCSPHIGHO2_02_FULL_53_20]|nr:MAG: DNA-directed RNA polymerase subunit beta' [Candidatus Peribacteria bacterium RIFCSPHIGHO2_02_FULL_53_20]OGJ67205.1 MAG: DNA-directed RNA polymerase subunit beta' [Candidatus Peribacteria bacterium RIFCSPLOWO2_01_FULL_53_10]OGJ69368.1 MAG: DNA-directed RNA polymerase subunit beta' [Candidatus Peribacteria bacterium RIFCSPLOWO2_12_FULL_53_10]
MPPPAHKSAATDSFDAVSLSVASPEDILGWSRGEITKPETVNYRTQRAEPDGLFCERIFGPTKNFQCFCGKYKGVRYAGVVCEKCGVEVTRSIVRRERMGHINLAVPVTHIWFLRSSPSRLGLLLDLPIKTLEQIVYFAAYIVIAVDEEAKKLGESELNEGFEKRKNQVKREYEDAKKGLQESNATRAQLDALDKEFADKLESLKNNHRDAGDDLSNLAVGTVLSELKFREMNMKFGHVFRAGTGAESLREIVMNINLDQLVLHLEKEREKSSGQKLKKIMKRIKLVSSLKKAGIKAEWTILTRLAVIPPDLRPMVQLDGGRFAASDLNDLYRRVINRNNRLKKLMSIGAPEVICRNEKRMLQEAVDTLLNNSARAGKTLFTAGDRRKLRSLSDMLKGKQGRFRQNLLGKRVDYSGRSVIVVGPHLRLNQCGLPKEMAMKLFKPFVIGRLIRDEQAHNVKGAERIVQDGGKEVWDILEEVIQNKYVLLNRAPTLHRLGIQAFNPLLIEGLAIQLHPLVCAAFNADFDGDQMAVHVPLSDKAQKEAKELMAANNNVLKPSAGEPVINPVQDMVLGCYFLTQIHEGRPGQGMVFSSPGEASLAYDNGFIDLQSRILVRYTYPDGKREMVETSVGRLKFQEIVPPALGFLNQTMKKKNLSDIIARSLDIVGREETVALADRIKDIGFHYATKSGISISQSDIRIPKERDAIVAAAGENVRIINNYFWKGLITADERYSHAIRIWSKAKNDVSAVMVTDFLTVPENPITYVIDSGARGNWGQVTQLAGMKGLVANPSGRTIELPIQSNLKDGFSVLEFFIATHGGRKGKSDTALKTAEAGYLTRRLVDAVQDIVIREDDCGSKKFHLVTRSDSEKIGEKFEVRIFGRRLAEDLEVGGETIAKRNDEIDAAIMERIKEKKVEGVALRSVMTCKTLRGICQKCYGRDLGDNKPVMIGTPVGIIAAQSIGEPGTQLTMRTFHMGGVAEGGDITQGLTRVEELFEARTPRTPAILSDIAGTVKVSHASGRTVAHVVAEERGEDRYLIPAGYKITVKKGQEVRERTVIAKSSTDKSTVKALIAGAVTAAEGGEVRIRHEQIQERDYEFTSRETVLVKNGDNVEAGQPLNAGHFNLHELLEKKGAYSVQNYIIQEVQHIYSSQGQTINDKHLEIIVRKMFSKVRIIDAGGTTLLPGETADIGEVLHQNDSLGKGKKGATYESLLLGITRAALATDSWLAGASFQETIRVLVEAATTRRVDALQGLKENVIIGRLIPTGEVYRQRFISEEAAKAEKAAKADAA